MCFTNATIIKSGYATLMTMPPNVKYAELFEELYKEARKEKRGLWKDVIQNVTKEQALKIADKRAQEALNEYNKTLYNE